MREGHQATRAQEFHHMHHQQELLVLPNVWDAGSSVIFEKQGFKALGTTSAGIAYSQGLPDGEVISLETLLRVTRQITARISIPLSVDVEKGYGQSPEQVSSVVRQVVEAGAVGINLEDGNPGRDPWLDDQALMKEKIIALMELKAEMKIPFVINARTCVYWLEIGEETKRLDHAVKRADAFKEAGADCVFIPGALSRATIEQLLKQIDLPLNTIANPLFNDVKALESIGVKRLSIGSGAARSAYGHLLHLASDLKDNRLDRLLSGDFSYNKANQFFAE